jgi:glutamine synthetase
MEAARVPVEFSKGEWGRGQEEINLRYAEALEMADRHVLYKHGVKEIAWAQGASVTFMAKYDMGAAGSSCHLHSSVWDPRGRKNLFAAHGSRAGTPLFRHWLGGQMAMARDFAYFYAPTINAYKRYQAGSFAPTRIACGWDNRTCGFRLCGEGASFRVENRIPGADANPYLAFAALLGAGLDGIENGTDPGPELKGNAYEAGEAEAFPSSLREAVDLWEKSDFAKQAFGDAVHKHYLNYGQLEQGLFDKVVTDYEKRRMFERG